VARNDTDAGPWYREPWPWLLMAGPALVIVAGVLTLYLALTTEDGLVVDDYYRQGLAINAVLARDERARALGINAMLQASPQRDRVQVTLEGARSRSPRLRLRMVHPTRSGQDQAVPLLWQADQVYAAAIRPLTQGSWLVVLEDEASGWRLVGTLQSGQERLQLMPQTGR